jgi:restriction endonuclease Mrr
MAAVDAMSGRQFRALLEHFFARQGYRVARLSARGHGGDLLISDPQGRTIVQLKRWSGMVRSDSVQRAVVAKSQYGVSRVLVVTSSNYSEEAETAANSGGVTLWNRATLDSELSLFDGDSVASGVKRLPADLQAGTRICLGAVAALFVGVLALIMRPGRRSETSDASASSAR